jgi:hypothetical protein
MHVDDLEESLRNAGRHTFAAERTCLAWESQGGNPELVGSTAERAISAAESALEALGEDGLAAIGTDRQSRQGRLACAAWLILLVGTDEGGTSDDLRSAASLFLKAANL